MMMPKRVKYRGKQQRGRRKGKAWRGSTLSFGDYGLKALKVSYVTDLTDRSRPYRDDALRQARR